MNIKSRYFKSKIAVMVAALACPLLFGGCSVKYSLSGASIAPEIQTVSIARFPNNALLVAPILSSTLTDALQDRFTRQTRLAVVPETETCVSRERLRITPRPPRLFRVKRWP